MCAMFSRPTLSLFSFVRTRRPPSLTFSMKLNPISSSPPPPPTPPKSAGAEPDLVLYFCSCGGGAKAHTHAQELNNRIGHAENSCRTGPETFFMQKAKSSNGECCGKCQSALVAFYGFKLGEERTRRGPKCTHHVDISQSRSSLCLGGASHGWRH